ncbi:hypothetical protein BVG16_12205 [Paenibacillus selenitireducens]|uniref:Uncharacterized protein n=1 Tax=Paenibacillus selenitireducens TaxID=1324314 RepID=A0A1T2XFF7_9BACL|nr:hypothetical protein [Paenibacillus selenitireducens]OPA78621.1 hypothetical protein BVG16_12205 [Paenibacillus selenitireducens]
MNTCSNINSLLLRHFENGGNAAGYLRGRIPGFAAILSDFFASRSDIERIQKAEHLSECILSLTDFGDMIPLRSEVATLEIKRMIAYKKQTDHTAHTLYLYILGVWVYDNITEIRDALDARIHSSKPMKLFLFQWTFASLLHDVGYLFYDFDRGANASSWNIYDRMLSFEYFNQYTDELSDQGKSELEQAWGTLIKTYGMKEHASNQNAKELIASLDQIPWLADLIPGYQTGLLAMELGEEIGPGLQRFAYDMASHGYDGTPVVDHGIASGLMLLKYTSIWYWLHKHSETFHPQLHAELNAKFHYYPHIFHKHVLPACKAAAYHNLPNVTYSLEQDPLLYLAVLCDELQIWDRFMSGAGHIDNWRMVDHCVADKLKAERIASEWNQPMLHLMTSEVHFEKLVSSLDKRVLNWNKYVQVTRI